MSSNEPTQFSDLFPEAVPATDWLGRTTHSLTQEGFGPDRSLAAVGLCRDEIARPLDRLIEDVWGPTFSLTSLAGLFTAGITGLGAAAHHVPQVEGVRNLVVFSFPHIGFDDRLGYVSRPGMENPSGACGALHALVGEGSAPSPDIDPEQSLLHEAVLPGLGDGPTLLEATLATATVNETRLVEALDRLVDQGPDLRVALVTGIQIHTGGGADYIAPRLTRII